jgi:hypothetical protein
MSKSVDKAAWIEILYSKKQLTFIRIFAIIVSLLIHADMAESADALDSGSSRSNTVEVQVLLSAPEHRQLIQ